MSRGSWDDNAASRALTAQVRREEPICWLCGKAWDPQAESRSPWSFSVDHILPQSTHPHLRYVRSNLRAAHYRCNTRRGKKPVGRTMPTISAKPIQSREW